LVSLRFVELASVVKVEIIDKANNMTVKM